MGCIESSNVRVANSMKKFKKNSKCNDKENEDSIEKTFRFSVFEIKCAEKSNIFLNDQSKIFLNELIENNAIILT